MTRRRHAQHRHAFRHRRAHGMTLAELILAIAGISVVAMAVVSMLFAVSYGSDEDKSVRSLTVEAKAVSTRLNAAIRGSRRLLDESDTRLILWTRDADADGLVDLDELRILDFAAEAARLSSSVVADDATPADYDALATDFAAVVAALDDADDLDATPWSNRVADFAHSTDSPDDATGATLLSYRLTLTHSNLTETVAYAAALRNRKSTGS